MLRVRISRIAFDHSGAQLMTTPKAPVRTYGRSPNEPNASGVTAIELAEEFVRLRESPEREDCLRPVQEEVSPGGAPLSHRALPGPS
jgi:hypothetical protein